MRIANADAALKQIHHALRPGGVALITVPGITPVDRGEWKESWYWSFTKPAMQKTMAQIFPAANVTAQNFGNVLVANALLYGMGLPELKKEQMDYTDPHYQVIITVKAVKPQAA